MYIEAKKDIYGTLEASLLLWTKLSKSLEEMVYQRNECDWCVLKIVNGKQCTILWHVDNLKMSYVDFDIFLAFCYDIDAAFVKIAKMTITRIKIHKYLGMNIN